ncbi:hypothetical protein [Xenorhabdus mauleonii]|uniref:hypothetical protein n=1 Tax=Xenorhabdus mauleonii TaxID=351675 RepID=UPI0014730D64|nr:hypothetical protein [Xenorhabdus mauleonii]
MTPEKIFSSLALPQICGNSESGVNASSLQAMLLSDSNGSMPLLSDRAQKASKFTGF